MNLSMKWLSDYVDVSDVSIKDYCHAMTMSGSKVEGYEAENAEISNVVCAKILSVVPHENSDHLVVCQVDVGKDEPVQIVTGASNVNAGDIVPAALDNSTLPNGVKIKKGKLRGVESNGMLCSLGELKLTKNDFPYAIEDGIFIMQEDAQIGQDICSAIGLDDTSVEFEITSNRPDCLSVIGLARETAATFGKKLNAPEPRYKGIGGSAADTIKVDVHNTELCPRYMAAVVKNAKIEPSPRWMRERLRASGVRPINNFVDITNYVMLEYGQPMHAFDLKYVEDAHINVRNAQAGETITTLDGIERELSSEMLVICDGKKPVAVAGVMGGEYSGIMDDTTTVVFESANFEPASVRKTAKKLGMRSDSSARFEKGLNAGLCENALKRALQLVEILGAGDVVNEYIDIDNSDKSLRTAPFNAEKINEFLGTDISESDMISYLESLELKVEGDKVIVPDFRIDVECMADVAEEVARIYGYNNIPPTVFKGVAQGMLTEKQQFIRKIENTVSALGGSQILTYSFISPKHFEKMCLPQDSTLRNVIRISNPLGEDTSVMRPSMLPSMLEVLSTNYNYRNEKAFLYEIAKEYIPDADSTKLPCEPDRLCIGMYGNVDFYDIKGVLEALLAKLGINDYIVRRPNENTIFGEAVSFHPYRCAVVEVNGTEIAIFGEAHPDVAENYDIGTKVYLAKLNVNEALSISNPEITCKEQPKFPAITRDIALVCDDDIEVFALESAIKGAIGKILEKVTLFDVYKGSQIESGKKSVAYSIVMRSADGTLTDEQAEAAMKRVLKALSQLGAEIRS
ncbi:MAG: phenylalanine--tRNA ligase subunit beta [Oscillospiraceae bacterium]|nr:phenylalanine--tRNA ligase subunit beta [Oscillospiraceae bacterium]